VFLAAFRSKGLPVKAFLSRRILEITGLVIELRGLDARLRLAFAVLAKRPGRKKQVAGEDP